MNDERREEQDDVRKDLARKIEVKEKRKIKSRAEKEREVWFGLGMFGLVGWSVAIPTVLLLAVGIWIDSKWPTRFSWTLMFLVMGIAVGCWNAWYWVKRQSRGDNGSD